MATYTGPGGPIPPDRSQAASKKLAAGITGILLGWLGIHKFVLGYNTAGIILLIVSLVTCGAVGSIVGIIEGIIYLTRSDEEFYQTYMVGRKEWF